MALTRCQECGTEVSTKADRCPKCGAPVKKKTSGCAMVFAVAAVLGLVVYIGSLTSSSQSSETPNPPPTQGSSDRDRIYEQAKAKFNSSIAGEYRKLIEFQKAGDTANTIRILNRFKMFHQLGYQDVAAINQRVRTQDYVSRLQRTKPNDYRALSETFLGLHQLYPDNKDYAARSAEYASALKRQDDEKQESERKATEEREARASRGGKDEEAWIYGAGVCEETPEITFDGEFRELL